MKRYLRPKIFSPTDHIFYDVQLQATGVAISANCDDASSECGGSLGYSCFGQLNADWRIDLELADTDCTSTPAFSGSGCTVDVVRGQSSGSLSCTTSSCSGDGCTDAAAYQISCINGSSGNSISCFAAPSVSVSISCPSSTAESCEIG